jgi:hypothetical protein
MVWTGKGNLHYLIDILKERGYILVKKELYDLFKDPYNCPDVRWNGDKLEYLALLIYRLCNEGFITLKVNKGNFSFAERHFTDFAGNKIKKNTLKNLSYEMNADKSRYSYVHDEINEIIARISKP